MFKTGYDAGFENSLHVQDERLKEREERERERERGKERESERERKLERKRLGLQMWNFTCAYLSTC